MEFNLLNEQNFKDRYNIYGCHGFDCRDLEINSITRDNNECYYFTGRNNHSLWIGKLDSNLKVIWEKNDFDEGLRNRLETGLKIIYESDDNIFAISEYPISDYSGKSYLISINSIGEKNWGTILKVREYEMFHNCMIKINNFLYAVTMYSDDYGARDYRTYRIPAYALLNKISFDGKIESSSEIFVENNKISFKSITSNTKNSFFISGFVHALSFNKRNYFDSKASVFKFNSEGKKGKSIIDYTNEGEND